MKNLITVLVVFSSIHSYGQNLVPNPSFEEYLDCPFSTAELQNQVIDWYSWNETPDFFHECSNEMDGFAGVPENAWGYQWPLSGEAYAGFVTFVDYAANAREYLACQLIEPLEVGEDYYIRFAISTIDGDGQSYCKCATDRLGAKFFKDPTYGINQGQTPYTPQNNADIEHNEFISDTANWILIEGWFTADSMYNWLAIGNFYDDQQTNTIELGWEDHCCAIYYIDNVCVTKNPTDCDYLLSVKDENENKIKVIPNPFIGELKLNFLSQQIKRVSIYNINGKLVYNSLINSNGININTNNWANGIYLLKVHLKNDSFINYKIMKL